MLVALLLLLVAAPATPSVWAQLAANLVLVMLLLAAVRAVHSVGGLRLGLALLVPNLVLIVAHLARGVAVPSPWVLVSQVVFFGWATVCLLRLVLQAGPVDNDRMLGAVAVYLMLALVAARLFCLVEVLAPGSYAQGGEGLVATELVDALHYFSLVTLSTLGYGDVTPVTPLARNLACLEAVLGQLYLAILVARLVGLRMGGQPIEAVS